MKISVLSYTKTKKLSSLIRSTAKQRRDIMLTNVESIKELKKQLDSGQHFDALLSNSDCDIIHSLNKSIPFIKIEYSEIDISKSLQLALKVNSKVVLLIEESYRGFLKSIDFSEIEIINYTHAQDLSRTFSRLNLAEDIIIVGEKEVCELATSHNIKNIQIAITPHAINKAFDRAYELCQFTKKPLQIVSILTKHLYTAQRNLLIYDGIRTCIYESKDVDEHYARACRKLIDRLENKNSLELIRSINRTSVIIKGEVIFENNQKFYVFEIVPTLYDQRTKIPGLSIKHREDLSTNFYNFFYNHNQNNDLKYKTISYSQTQTPIIIIGESGTGKSRMADFIYDNCSRSDHPFYVLDCKILDTKSWSTLFSSLYSPLYNNNSTFYFKEVNLIPEKSMRKLKDFLMNTNTLKTNKYIFSVTSSLDQDIMPIESFFINHVGAISLTLDPLRERLYDIPGLASLYIDKLNQETGKHSLGFEPEALTYLQSYHWPENLKQFKRIITLSHTLSFEPYVTVSTLQKLIDEEYKRVDAAITHNTILYSKGDTLESSTKRLIEEALRQHGFNQSETANSLGISRTTLWRIMKNR